MEEHKPPYQRQIFYEQPVRPKHSLHHLEINQVLIVFQAVCEWFCMVYSIHSLYEKYFQAACFTLCLKRFMPTPIPTALTKRLIEVRVREML